MSELITPAEYYDRLKKHDWWHMMADDGAAWERGRREEQELSAIAEQHPELMAMWEQHRAYARPVDPATGYTDTTLRDTLYPKPDPRPADGRLCGQLSLLEPNV